MANADRVTERHLGRFGNWLQQGKVQDRIHWICSQVRGEKVLDLGCSQGITSILLGREGFEAVGVDVQPEAIKFAGKALKEEPPEVRERVSFVGAGASDMPFDAGTFDTVIMGELIEQLTNPSVVLDEVRRVLKRGGRVVITVPFGEHRCADHKHVYYALSLYRLLHPRFHVESLNIKNGFICAVACRANEEPSDEQIPYRELLEKLEEALSDLEFGRRRVEEKWQNDAKKHEARIAELERGLDQKRAQSLRLEGDLKRAEARVQVLEEELDLSRQELRAKENEASVLKQRLRLVESQVEREELNRSDAIEDRLVRLAEKYRAKENRLQAIVDGSGLESGELEHRLVKLVKAYTQLCQLHGLVTEGVRFKIGDAFVRAAKPSLDTVVLPLRLGALFVEGSKKVLDKRIGGKK
jgi:2-polyprenyl-6-hydroxyphenyl methylase/3-demethylubiquinone-9 3-methyltransferase